MTRAPAPCPAAPLAAALAALLASLAPPAGAQVQEARFDLVIRGINAAQLAMAGQEASGRYSVSAKVRGTGLVGRITNLQYDVDVQGAARGGTYAPSSYSETDDDDTVTITWAGGRPDARRTPPRPARPYDIVPAEQAGTVDPLTALWAVLRDQPAAGACDETFEIFDGTRRSRLTLGPPQAAEGGVTCTGQWLRVSGYSPRDMGQAGPYAFSVRYDEADGMLRAQEVRTQSTYGNAALRRR